MFLLIRFETHDLSRRAAEDLRLRPRGHWDWLYKCVCREKVKDGIEKEAFYQQMEKRMS
jgi:hypothetical protein